MLIRERERELFAGGGSGLCPWLLFAPGEGAGRNGGVSRFFFLMSNNNGNERTLDYSNERVGSAVVKWHDTAEGEAGRPGEGASGYCSWILLANGRPSSAVPVEVLEVLGAPLQEPGAYCDLFDLI